MSTFNGILPEFPDLRIDHFRPNPSGAPPLAFLLSHVHSDHLVGLAAVKSPFIYCSPATAALLPRLEHSAQRLNFARGIVEARAHTYRHVARLLKPLPLGAPARIELAPGRSVRVTALDANHCVGAVMFLIEGGGRAVLYTGDVRAELWWVNALVRSPALVPYACDGARPPVRTLDNVYLDTTFATKEDPYRSFQSKGEGLRELLRKVERYPAETLFYLDSWTFGYEDVWVALSAFLRAPIHVDAYRWGLYRALANGSEPRVPETPALVGFSCGNHEQAGCLTQRQDTRIHSCEKGAGCAVWQQDFVRITPVVSRHDGVEVRELGAGGGHGDMDQVNELETSDPAAIRQLLALIAAAPELQRRPDVQDSLQQLLHSAAKDGRPIDLGEDLDQLPIERLIPALRNVVETAEADAGVPKPATKQQGLPKRITFPYSRHSSYDELCSLVDAFRPKQIHPCTVAPPAQWTPAMSMSHLFGHLYSEAPTFRHDQHMLAATAARRGKRPPGREDAGPADDVEIAEPTPLSPAMPRKRPPDDADAEGGVGEGRGSVIRLARPEAGTEAPISDADAYRLLARRQAWDAARSGTWDAVGLVSVNGHQAREAEL